MELQKEVKGFNHGNGDFMPLIVTYNSDGINIVQGGEHVSMTADVLESIFEKIRSGHDEQ